MKSSGKPLSERSVVQSATNMFFVFSFHSLHVYFISIDMCLCFDPVSTHLVIALLLNVYTSSDFIP